MCIGPEADLIMARLRVRSLPRHWESVIKAIPSSSGKIVPVKVEGAGRFAGRGRRKTFVKSQGVFRQCWEKKEKTSQTEEKEQEGVSYGVRGHHNRVVSDSSYQIYLTRWLTIVFFLDPNHRTKFLDQQGPKHRLHSSRTKILHKRQHQVKAVKNLNLRS